MSFIIPPKDLFGMEIIFRFIKSCFNEHIFVPTFKLGAILSHSRSNVLFKFIL